VSRAVPEDLLNLLKLFLLALLYLFFLRVLRAVWSTTVLAEAARPLVVEGIPYFPPDAVHWEHLLDSPTLTWCWWKGRAQYLSIAIDDEVVADAAWYYPRPWPMARRLKRHVAFGPSVRIEGHVDSCP
jgi:uncharacterized protein (DUF427 family)